MLEIGDRKGNKLGTECPKYRLKPGTIIPVIYCRAKLVNVFKKNFHTLTV
jgi:hypothetical protein